MSQGIHYNESENLLTQDLRRAFGNLNVEFRDYYSHTKVCGEGIDRFLALFKEDADAQDESISIKWHDVNEISVKYL